MKTSTDTDQRVIKLNRRIEEPLPSYSDSQINRKRKINVNGASMLLNQEKGENEPKIDPQADPAQKTQQTGLQGASGTQQTELMPKTKPQKRKKKTSVSKGPQRKNKSARSKSPNLGPKKADGDLLKYFTSNTKRRKKSETLNERDLDQKRKEQKKAKLLKMVDNETASQSGSSSQFQVIKPKPQKTKLTQLWGIKVATGLEGARSDAPEILIQRRMDQRDREIAMLRDKNEEISRYLEMKKQQIIRNDEKIKMLKEDHFVSILRFLDVFCLILDSFLRFLAILEPFPSFFFFFGALGKCLSGPSDLVHLRLFG